jgi:gliding motility-associated-like protein
MLSQNIKSFLLTGIMLLISTISIAQCGISTNEGNITPTTTPQNTPTITSGKPYWQFDATAGCEYTFTTCGNSSLDTYLRLYQDGAWTLVTSNDDDCGTRSTITWTAPSTMTYNILLTSFSCNNLSGSGASITYSSSCNPGTCSDGIQNQGETGIDCGGPCAACPVSCNDGIQNQGETGVDCGGPCAACPTCNDGIQNGGETGIDCGGPCTDCPVLCGDLGFENMATNADQVVVSGWELMVGRNNVAGPYTIETPLTHSNYNCGVSFGDDHSLASWCGIGGSGVKVCQSDYEHHDIKANTSAAIGDLIAVPNLPNLGGTNNRCIRLGGEQQIGMEASGMKTTFTVADPYLAYHYILRFENTGHTINNRGFCTFEIKDAGGTVLPCGSFQVYENGPTENWAYDNGWNTWYMADWKTTIVDLTSFIGQTISIEVWVADCQEGAHAGWGYFDFECLASGTPDCSVGPSPCSNAPTVTLASNNGSTCVGSPVTVNGNVFGGSATSVTITENGSGSVTPTSSGSSPFSFTYTPSAGDVGIPVTITVTSDNPDGAPCVPATVTYTLTVEDIDDPSLSTNTLSICEAGGTIDLTAYESGTTGGTWTGTGVSGGNFNPSAGSQTVTYTVGTAPCTDDEDIVITVIPDVNPSLSTNTLSICEVAGTIDLTAYENGTTGGTWSGTGVSGGNFDPSVGSQTVTYTVGTTPCTEDEDIVITVTPDVDPGLSSNTLSICEAAGTIDLTVYENGTTGGTWSGTGVSGGNFNPSAGSQTVTYTVGTAPCTEDEDIVITVTPDVDPSLTSPTASVCETGGIVDLTVYENGTTGGTWSGTGVSGGNFDPLVGSQTVTYTVGTVPCTENEDLIITVISDVDPSLSTNTLSICEAAGIIDLTIYENGTTGGTWTGTGVSSGNFDPSLGSQTATYTVGTGSCTENEDLDITIIPDVDPSLTTPTATVCETSGIVDLTVYENGTTGGTWSGTGVSGGNFDPSIGSQTATYTVGTAPCEESEDIVITVIPDVDPTLSSNAETICEATGIVDLTVYENGTTGGTWSGTGVSGTNFDPSAGSQTVIYTVGTTPCTENEDIVITVNPDVDPSLTTNTTTICEISGTIDLTTFENGTTGGTWSGTGVSGTNFDPSFGNQTLTYTVGTSPCDESSNLNITVEPDVDPSLTTNTVEICETDGTIDLTTFEDGTTGGTWSGTGVSGTNFDPSVGSQTVIYTVGNSPCDESEGIAITVNPDVDPSLSLNNVSICVDNGPYDLSQLESGTTGGTWSGTGVSGANFDPSSGTQTLMYTVGIAPCTESENVIITVDPMDDASFTYPSSTFCVTGANPIATITGISGGTFSTSSPGVLLDNATGEVDLTSSGISSFWIYYNTTPAGNPCPSIDSVQVSITSAPEANFSYDANSFCLGGNSPIISFGSGSSAGVFSATPAGLTINVASGLIDLANSSPGNYWVYNNITASGGCASAIDSTEITLIIEDDASFSYSGPYCVSGVNPIAIVTGTSGGTFTISTGGVLLDNQTGEIDLSNSGIGSFWIYYNTTIVGNPCPNIDSIQVDIVTSPTASFSINNSPFCQGDTSTVLPVFGPNAFQGSFSSNPSGVVFIDSNTGQLDLVNSPAGNYWIINNLVGSGGCAPDIDSTQITINSIYSTPVNIDICQGDSIILGGAYQNSSGQYEDTLSSIFGCDSIIVSNLTVIPSLIEAVNISICQGDSVLLESLYQTISGNYYDTLIASSGCDSIIETILLVNPIPPTPSINDTIVCLIDGNPVLTVNELGTISWHDDSLGTTLLDTGATYSPNVNGIGTYTYYIQTSVNGCTSEFGMVSVTVNNPVADILSDPITPSGTSPLSINFSDLGSGAINYSWDFDDGNYADSSFVNNIFTSTGTYEVVLTVDDGTCTDYDTLVVTVIEEDSWINIPNIFSPNGDGSNDIWFVDIHNIDLLNCYIYNRWGQLLYEYHTINGGWNGRTVAGTEASDGTYYYILDATGQDNKLYNETGTFHLTR